MVAVYPLHTIPGNATELRYSLRSMEMYAPQIDDVMVLGTEKPSWFLGNFQKYAQDPKLTGVSNVLHKMKRACEMLGSGEMLWMMDDILILKPYKPYPIRHAHKPPHYKDVHHKGIQYAIEELAKRGKKMVNDYELHCPFLVDVERLHKLLSECDITRPLSIRTLYYNLHAQDSTPAVDFKTFEFATPKEGRPYYSSSDQSVTNSVFTTWCEKTFPNESRYEISYAYTNGRRK